MIQLGLLMFVVRPEHRGAYQTLFRDRRVHKTYEAIAARAEGMEVFGLSLVTNLAAGLSGAPLDHQEVLAAGAAAATRIGELLRELITRS